MKHLIVEKARAWVIFVEASEMNAICRLADSIEAIFPGYVYETRYNRKAGQGIIFLKKDDLITRDNIRDSIKIQTPLNNENNEDN